MTRGVLMKACFLAALATCALAHMSLTPATIAAGGRAIFQIGISHDCGEDTIGTSNMTVVLPEGLFSVTVEHDPTWYTVIHKVPVDPPVTVGSATYNETVRSVEFLGFLPDGMYKLFGIKAQASFLPNGTQLYFKGYQSCGAHGTDIAWDEMPDAANPAPSHPAVPVTVLFDSSAPASTSTKAAPVTTAAHMHEASSQSANNSTSNPPTAGLHKHLHGPPEIYKLYKTLREGGHVVFMRHGKTDVYGKDTFPDAVQVATQPCSAQRNLSPFGRAAASETGLSWNILGIPVGVVHTSLYCRTRETAQLAFGSIGGQLFDDMSLVPSDESIPLLGDRLRKAFKVEPARGTNTILVGHVFTMYSYDGGSIEEGEAVVAKPGNGTFEEVGRISMTKWGDLTRDYLAFGDEIFAMAEQHHHASSGGATSTNEAHSHGTTAPGTTMTASGGNPGPHAGHRR